MKILQTFIQMICLALQFTNLSLVYKSDISSIIPHNQILTLLAIFLYMYVCLSLISG